MSELHELLARVTATAGADRTIDGLFARVDGLTFGFCGDEGWFCGGCGPGRVEGGCGSPLGLHDERHSYPRNWWEDERLVPYTASVDAALALVQRKVPGCWYIMSKGQTRPDEPLYACELVPEGDHSGNRYLGVAEAATQPLAILAALLNTLIASESSDATEKAGA